MIAAKDAVAAAQDRELQAAKEREALEASLAELKASFRPHKTARAEAQDAEDISLDAEETEETETVDPEAWETYRLQMFRSLFRKYRKTSTKRIDLNNTETELPAKGDDNGKRGWRNHSQRGLIGAVRHWADGSPFRVAFMLAQLITYFECQDAVSLAPTCTLGPRTLSADVAECSAHTPLYPTSLCLRWPSASV